MECRSSHGLSLAVVVIVAAAGCPAAQVKPPPPPQPSLVGAWQSGCFKIVNADETEGSARATFGVTDSLWAMDTQIFGDDTCGQVVGTVHSDGGYALERPSSIAPGAWELRLDVRTRKVTPHVDGFIAYLQAVSCGDGYKVDRAMDILDLSCPALGAQPFATCGAEHDVVVVNGMTLTLGARPADGNVCTPAARPRALGKPFTRMP